MTNSSSPLRSAILTDIDALGRALQDPNLDGDNRAAILDQIQRLGAALAAASEVA